MKTALIKLFLFFIITSLGGILFAQYSPETQKEIDGYNKIIKSPFKSKEAKANAYDGLGNVYRMNENYQGAIQAHEKSLAYFESIGDKYSQAWCYRYLGNAYVANKSFKKGLEYYNLSYNFFYDTDYRDDAAQILAQIAQTYSLQFDYVKALEYCEKAYNLNVKIKNKDGISQSLISIGYVYQNMGNLPKAMEYFEKALAFERARTNKDGIATCLISISWIYFEQGNYYKTLECAKESLALYTSNYNDQGMGNAYNIIGAGYQGLKLFDTALEYFTKSLKKSREVGDQLGVGVAYNNIAVVYFYKKDYPESLKYHKLGLEISSETNELGSIILSTSNVAYGYFNVDNYEKAREYAFKAEKMAVEYKNPRLIKMTKRCLFAIYRKDGDYVTAEKYGLEMLEVVDKTIALNFPTMSESEKENFFESVREEYMHFNDFALTRKKENPAITDIVYNNTLKHKGLSLKSSTAMRHAIHSSNDTLLIAEYESWLILKSEIAAAYARGENTTTLETKANTIEKNLVKNSQAFSDFDKIQNLTWLDVQKNLKEGEAAIEFLHFNEFDKYGNKTEGVVYCALIVTPTSVNPEMIPLCLETDLEKLLGSFGGNNLAYINRIYGTEEVPNSALYELIWKPLEPALSNTKTIYLSPTGLLHRVAFSAISKEKSTLLCDSYHIELQSSTGKVAMPEEFNLGTDWNITLFGGIDYDTDSSSKQIWSFLEGTKVEVENISQIFTAGNFKVAQSKTEEGFKENAPESDIIHMSTHGFFYPDPSKLTTSFEVDTVESEDLVFRGSNSSFGVKNFVFNKNPLMRSGLVLSGANRVWDNPDMNGKEDGVLTAYEVAQIDLRQTGLVVLSACETGLGDIHGSEGVYGLQRAFKMAGVKYIIMSLWQVPDKETQEFMTLFYKNLLVIKEPKLAFVNTQLTMRKRYNPYYWAAFVIIE